jgi:hypothetical protein
VRAEKARLRAQHAAFEAQAQHFLQETQRDLLPRLEAQVAQVFVRPGRIEWEPLRSTTLGFADGRGNILGTDIGMKVTVGVASRGVGYQEVVCWWPQQQSLTLARPAVVKTALVAAGLKSEFIREMKSRAQWGDIEGGTSHLSQDLLEGRIAGAEWRGTYRGAHYQLMFDRPPGSLPEQPSALHRGVRWRYYTTLSVGNPWISYP